MSDLRVEEFLRIVHRYYPADVPPGTNPGGSDRPPSAPTSELQHWQETWAQALENEPWVLLRNALQREFPGHELGTYTPAYHSACYTCIVYLPLPASGQQRLRVAGAISLLAPVYLVYGTEENIPVEHAERDQHLERALDELPGSGPWEEHFARFRHAISPAQQLHLHPTEKMQPTATVIAQVIERMLGHRRFPIEMARIPVPGIHVPYLPAEEPTLLGALFSANLASLP